MDSTLSCICSSLFEISEFESPSEFTRFQKYVKNLLTDEELVETPVENHFDNNSLFEEHWYKCRNCSQVWRLVYPDFPFKGLWKQVKSR